MARRDSGKKSAKGGKSLRGKGKRAAGARAPAKESPKWPTERPVLFKPDRLQYVRKMIKPQGCVFCNAVAAGVGPESLVLHHDDQVMVVMNKFPYNSGHILVLPKRHVGDLLEIPVEELSAITAMVQKVVKILTEVYAPPGFNLGLNLGTSSGAGIPEHLHFHIVPRWAGDTNFFALVAGTKVVVETLEQTFERLLPYFEGR
jgi:ATP adenylyltransferase